MALTKQQRNFLESIRPHVQRDAAESKVLASLTAAQAIIESNWGKSGLATKGFNLFGIKGAYNGQSITMKTREVYNGKTVYVDAAFRKYPSWFESIQDHSAFLIKNKRYKNVIGCKDYRAACAYIAQAGYATDPGYKATLISTIEKYGLNSWDVETPEGAKEPQPIKAPRALRLGDQGESVKEVQRLLVLEETGKFDQRTKKAVLEYQRANGLTPDGLVGVLTLDAMRKNPVTHRTKKVNNYVFPGKGDLPTITVIGDVSEWLGPGMQGGEVETLQRALYSAGYPVKITGVYDDETTAAVKVYQASKGLVADGICGAATIEALKL